MDSWVRTFDGFGIKRGIMEDISHAMKGGGAASCTIAAVAGGSLKDSGRAGIEAGSLL